MRPAVSLLLCEAWTWGLVLLILYDHGNLRARGVAAAEHPLAREYISDRLCNRISAKINESISTALAAAQQTTSTQSPGPPGGLATGAGAGAPLAPNDTMAFVYLHDGAKFPLWIQCYLAQRFNETTDTGQQQQQQQQQQQASTTALANAARQRSSVARKQHQHHQSHQHQRQQGSFDFDSILDWFERTEPSDRDLEAVSSKLPRIDDERYGYLLSVAQRCEPSILKRCNYFKLGLFTSAHLQYQNGTSSAPTESSPAPATVALSKRAACPACGLNDSNCDNVHQCTSPCGQIKSINYPANYGNNHRCRWSIRAPNGYYVNMSIVDFDIPSANNATKLATCIFDYLTLIDGYTGKRLGCYCNENLPPAYIVSPWNELIIQFDTNSETTGRGFYFQYEFQKLKLGDRLLAQLQQQQQQQQQPNNNNNNININSNNSPLCLSGWQYFRSSCYKAYNELEPLQWYNAEDRCQAHGEGLDGHLVSILDRDEMLVILYWLTNVWNSTRYREYYIGLIDASREGLYRWSDNNPMSYTDWELKSMLLEDETPAQPDGGAYEDCTVIRYNSFSRTSNWHDVPCSLGKHYHSHLDKGVQIKFKWDYVSSYICKSDSIAATGAVAIGGSGGGGGGGGGGALANGSSASGPGHNQRSRVRKPLFSNEFKLSLQQTPQQLMTQPPLTSSAAASAAGPASSAQGKPGGAQQTLAKLDDNRYFICDNLEVISTVLRCDGVAHCRDGSDESKGCDQDCLDWQFKCANGRCISVGYYCDFSDDCGDGSDESRCERHRCKLNEFRCQSGQCIPSGQRCDLLPDCRDASDEGRSCTVGSNCNPASTFQCYNGLCIPQYAVCDFQIDCPGKFHEDEDAATCELLQKSQGFVRLNKVTPALGSGSGSGSAGPNLSSNLSELLAPQSTSNGGGGSGGGIGESPTPSASLATGASPRFTENEYEESDQELGQQEDGDQYDDPSGSSPWAAATQTGGPGEVVFYPANRAASFDLLPDNLFRCKSGNTIDANQRCLFEFDRYGYQLGCRDVSHLVDCADFECPARDYVKCSNSYCIPWRYVCDGKWDCIMGDDEVGCARYVCPGQYKCANQSSCILLHQLCDGARQCPMGDDEWFCDLQCPLGCDCIGQSVNCRWAQLTSLPSNYIPKAVRKLDLSYNRLGPNLSNSNFDAYHDLGELILSHNEIEVLTPRKFHQLRNLYKLDLSYNRIHSVKRGAFAGLRRVTQLLLESNQQLFLLEPEAFLGLSSLQMLNISSSRIQSLRKNTFDGLTSLRHLLLRSNMILTIEDGAFRSLSSLVSLDMRGNDIKHFTKSVFSDLKSLRNLSTNSFKFCCLMNHQIPADKCLPLPDEISDCEDLLSSVSQRTCIWIAGGFALVGNLIVIIWRYRDRLGQKDREDQHVESTLLLSLGFSDLLMGIYLIVIALVDSWYRGRYIENSDKWRESPLCDFCGFLSTVSSTVSVLTLVFISYSRYLQICCPFKQGRRQLLFTLGFTQHLVRLCWLTALVIATLPLIIKPYFQGQFYAKSGVCLAYHITDQKAAGWLYSVLVSPCLNLVSFTIIVKCYISIYVKIAQRNSIKEDLGLTDEERSNHQIKIPLIILTHFVAFSPPMILGLISVAGHTPPAALYSWLAVSVLPVNSAINPMIYTIPHIRKTIDLLILNYRARKTMPAALRGGGGGASSRSPSGGGGGGSGGDDSKRHSRNQNGAVESAAGAQQTCGPGVELAPMLKSAGDGAAGNVRASLAERNVPPGYVPLRDFVQQSARLSVGHLVDIALAIARDIEEKHRSAKIYHTLRIEDIFVSECVGSRAHPPGAAAADDDDERAALAATAPRLAVFLADHDGYRQRRTQPCCFQLSPAEHKNHMGQIQHHLHNHSHHKTHANCECADVTRYGDILYKLVQLYNKRKPNAAAPPAASGPDRARP